MLSHDDKECDIWLKSKGSLTADQQQFGNWIRVNPFGQSRRKTIEVKGFDSGKSGQHVPQSEPSGEAELQRSSGLEYPLLTYEGGRIGNGMISGGLGN